MSFIGTEGLLTEASGQGWDGASAQMQDWLIFSPKDLADAKWDSMNNAPTDAQRRQMALEL